jgi:putative ABC transport system ATP-binding protein
MTLEFKSVLPFPLKDYKHADNSVWKHEFVLEFPSKVMLNASSGKGKSTFVNTVYGVRHDYDGTILLNGKDLKSLTLHDWIELRKNSLSVVFQDLQLFGELTAWENLQLKNNLTQHRPDEEIMTMLETLGIPDKKNQSCKTLSLGQQQRVAIIRSLLQPFELLLMDEPFSHLDDENSAIAMDLICRETEKNKGGFVLTSLGSKHGFTFDRELKL